MSLARELNSTPEEGHPVAVGLREPPRGGPGQAQQAMAPTVVQGPASAEHPGRRLCCATCAHPITTPTDAIEVAGAHRHTFANPHGHVFLIGCFTSAPGCRVLDWSSSDFPWFDGYRWRIALCGRCGTHLGWRFEGSAPSFFGLVLERLAVHDGRSA